jgi:uncharacterized protein
MPLQCEWDPQKAEANEAKHGVSFEEAITVFADPLARIFEDPEHSETERREIIVGLSDQQNLILVSSWKRTTGFDSSARARRPAWSVKTMRKTLARKRAQREQQELSSEYRFDYSRSKPNRFAESMSGGAIAIVLGPDVAAVFKSSKAVNA